MKENIGIRKKIEKVDYHIEKKNEILAEAIGKNMLGKKDLDELYRDASTYESNFARGANYGLNYYCQELVEAID